MVDAIINYAHILGPDKIIWDASYQPPTLKKIEVEPVVLPKSTKRIRKIKETTPLIINMEDETPSIANTIRNKLLPLLKEPKKIPIKFIRQQYELLGQPITAGAKKSELLRKLMEMLSIGKSDIEHLNI